MIHYSDVSFILVVYPLKLVEAREQCLLVSVSFTVTLQPNPFVILEG